MKRVVYLAYLCGGEEAPAGPLIAVVHVGRVVEAVVLVPHVVLRSRNKIFDFLF